MNRKGFTLIELLVATTLMMIATPILCQGLYEGTRYFKKINKKFDEHRLFYRASSYLEKDLRNAVLFSYVPFIGDGNALSFACLDSGIHKIGYTINNDQLLRTEKGNVIAVADHVKAFTIEYAYQDENNQIVFLSSWREPRLEIPKAVKMTIIFEGYESHPTSLFVALPQGTMGTVKR